MCTRMCTCRHTHACIHDPHKQTHARTNTHRHTHDMQQRDPVSRYTHTHHRSDTHTHTHTCTATTARKVTILANQNAPQTPLASSTGFTVPAQPCTEGSVELAVGPASCVGHSAHSASSDRDCIPTRRSVSAPALSLWTHVGYLSQRGGAARNGLMALPLPSPCPCPGPCPRTSAPAPALAHAPQPMPLTQLLPLPMCLSPCPGTCLYPWPHLSPCLCPRPFPCHSPAPV